VLRLAATVDDAADALIACRIVSVASHAATADAVDLQHCDFLSQQQRIGDTDRLAGAGTTARGNGRRAPPLFVEYFGLSMGGGRGYVNVHCEFRAVSEGLSREREAMLSSELCWRSMAVALPSFTL